MEKRIFNNPANVWVITDCKCPADKSYLCVEHRQAMRLKCYCNESIGLQCHGCKKLDPYMIKLQREEEEARARKKEIQSRCKHDFPIASDYDDVCRKCDISYGESVVCSVTGKKCVFVIDSWNKKLYVCNSCNRRL